MAPWPHLAFHEFLNQHLVVRHHFQGLERDEIEPYLTHRLRLAECELPLFELPAIAALCQASRGSSREFAGYQFHNLKLDGSNPGLLSWYVGCDEKNSEWSRIRRFGLHTAIGCNSRRRKGLEPSRRLSETTGPQSQSAFRIAFRAIEVT